MPQDPSDRDTRDDRVIFLLNRLGEQLIRSEKERLTMGVKLARIEQQQKETAAALAKAELITKQIGDMMAQQGRFSKRIEQLTHDKLRINRKLERIEDAVVQTRDALEAKALVLLTGQSVAGDSGQPQIPADPAKTVPVTVPENKVVSFREKFLTSHAASVAFIIGVTVFGGWAAVKLATTDYNDYNDNTVAASAGDQEADATPPQPATVQTAPASETPPPLPKAATADDGRPHPVLIHVAQGDGGTTVKSVPPVDDVAALATQMNDIAPAAGEPESRPAPATDTPEAEKASETFMNADALGSELSRVKPAAGRMAPDKPGNVEKIATPAAKAEPVSLPVAAPAAKQPVAKNDSAPAITKDDPTVEKFISRQRDAKALAERAQPDTSLPPVVQEIEKKALEGVPEAQHDLAALYVTGNAGVTQDYNKAAFWFREAAIGGVANARYNLGVLYQQGTGVPKDIAKAIEWYRAAAALGHPEAEYNLGIAHIEGVGAKYNPQAAAHYFRESADGGVVEAAYNLGLIYENALLGHADRKEALYWYKRAADRGNKQAEGAMQQLAKAMDLDDAGIEKAVGSLHPEETQAAAQAEAKKLAAETAAETASAPAPTPPPAEKTEASKSAAPPELSSDGADSQPAVSLEQPSIASTVASPATNTAFTGDSALLAQIQEQLVRRGLLPGPADGTGNQQTSDAIRAYQSTSGLNPDGRATQALLAHMLSSDIKPPVQKTAPTAHADAGGLNPADLQTPGASTPAKAD